MSEENKKDMNSIPTPNEVKVPTIKPVKVTVKPKVPTELPNTGIVIKPTPIVTPKPIEEKVEIKKDVIKPTPVVNPKPIEEEKVETKNEVIKPTPVVNPKSIEEEKVETKNEEVTSIQQEERKEEVKEEIKKVANPDPRFAPKNAYAPPDLTQDKEKLFEENDASYTNTNNDNNSEGDELYKSFIGKNYNKLMMRTINFSGLFFGVLYMFYRKLFLYGVLVILVQSFISIWLSKYIVMMPYLSFIPNILIFLFVNKIYLSYAGKKIDRIRNNNLHANIEDLKEKCKNEGGTSIGNIFAGLFTSSLIISAIILLLGVLGAAISFKKIYYLFTDPDKAYLLDDVEDDKELPQGKDYDGVMVLDYSKEINNIFNITVPDKFKKDETGFSYSYSTEQGVFNKCELNFSALKQYNNDEKLIKQIREYNKGSKPSDVKKEKINNITWYWISYENSIGKTYNYAVLYEKRVFFFEYKIGKDTDKDCESYKDKIIKSTSFR